MVEKRFQELDLLKEAEAKAFDDFLPKEAEDAFVNQVVGAFNEAVGDDISET